MVGGDPVGERVRASGIFGDVAADGTGLLAGGIGREMQARVRDGRAEIGIHDPGLHGRALIFEVDIENAIHARKNGKDAAVAGQRATGKTSAGAPADERGLILIGQFHDLLNMRGLPREDDASGTRDFYGTIVFVKQQFFGTMENGIIAKQRLQVAKEFRFHSWGAAKCELRAGGQYRWPSQEPSTRARPNRSDGCERLIGYATQSERLSKMRADCGRRFRRGWNGE